MNSNHFRPLRSLAVVGFLAVFVSCTGYRPSAVPPTPTPAPHTPAAEVTGRIFIARQTIVAVPHLSALDESVSAMITTTVTLNNTSQDALIGLLTARILDNDTGQAALAAPSTVPVSLTPGQSTEVQLTAVLASSKPWRADHPSQYRWITTLTSAEAKPLQVAEEVFGVRLGESDLFAATGN